MAMMIVSEDDWEAELNHFKPKEDKPSNNGNHGTLTVIHGPKHGRKEGSHEVPETLRNIAAITALEGESNDAVAAAFGISESSVSAYKNGATRTASYNRPDDKLSPVVDRTMERIHSRARNRLMQALTSLNKDKIAAMDKPRDIAAVAKDMASIIEKTSPKTPQNVQNNVILYSPHQMKKESYEVIDAPVSSGMLNKE